MTYNCPVCNKSGLQNFKKKHIVCSQCNSDLKGFLLIDNFERKYVHKKKYLWLIYTLIGIVFLLSFLFINNTVNKKTIIHNEKSLSELEDSINILKKENDIYFSQYTEEKTKVNGYKFIYKVKKGDNVSKIASYFYDDWREFEKIVKGNNLYPPYVLLVGQELEIKLEPK